MSDNDFQAASSEQGRQFEDLVVFMLKAQNWIVNDRHVFVAGAEIDIVATHPDGTRWWIECKGSHRGKVPGCRRGDTVKKAVGVAAYLKTQTVVETRPYMLVTSHLPQPGTIADQMLRTALQQRWFDHLWDISKGWGP